MTQTKYSRKLDTSGRIMIPSKLREQYNLTIGEEYSFYLHETGGRTYICIECPKTSNAQIQEAINLLEKNGFSIDNP